MIDILSDVFYMYIVINYRYTVMNYSYTVRNEKGSGSCRDSLVATMFVCSSAKCPRALVVGSVTVTEVTGMRS